MAKDLSLLDLLGLAGFHSNPGDRIVRHQDAKYPAADLLHQELLETYQAYRSRPVFHKAGHVLTFYGLDGTRACFFGVFRNDGHRDPRDGPLLTKSPWEIEWRKHARFFYQLQRVSGLEHLEDRVIIDWGRAALAWYQGIAKADKRVLEITAPRRRGLPPFRDYLEFDIAYDQLVELYRDEDAYREWRSRLSAVAGVYLILAETTGELYVGSATGAEGIWGRWREYARTGHAGNDTLRDLISSDRAYPSALRFSILQILPRSMTREEVLGREARLKVKLGCRAHGLNLN